MNPWRISSIKALDIRQPGEESIIKGLWESVWGGLVGSEGSGDAASGLRLLMGVLLLFAGLVIILASVLIMLHGSKVSGFGFILIGPVPLVIGGGVEALYLLLAIFVLVVIVVMLSILRMVRSV